MLIDHGLDPNDRHKDGFTPLHRACWGDTPRHTNTVRVLLEAGVPADQKSSDGKTPLQLTQNRGTMKVLEEYLDKAATEETKSTNDDL